MSLRRLITLLQHRLVTHITLLPPPYEFFFLARGGGDFGQEEVRLPLANMLSTPLLHPATDLTQ